MSKIFILSINIKIIHTDYIFHFTLASIEVINIF